jgi:hypothetical protein
MRRGEDPLSTHGNGQPLLPTEMLDVYAHLLPVNQQIVRIISLSFLLAFLILALSSCLRLCVTMARIFPFAFRSSYHTHPLYFPHYFIPLARLFLNVDFRPIDNKTQP